LVFNINHYLYLKYFLGAIQNLSHDLSVEISIRIAVIKKGIAFIIHVTRVVARETKHIPALALDAVQLKFQIDGAAVMFNFYEVNDRLAVASSKVFCIARKQGDLSIDKRFHILRIRDPIELPYID
jgi:hypothetical protein